MLLCLLGGRHCHHRHHRHHRHHHHNLNDILIYDPVYPQPIENSFHPLGRLRQGACGYHWLGKTGIVTNGDDDIFEKRL